MLLPVNDQFDNLKLFNKMSSTEHPNTNTRTSSANTFACSCSYLEQSIKLFKGN